MLMDDFLPKIQLMVPDAEPLQMQEAVRDAVADFMADTQVFTGFWEIPYERCVKEYLIDLPECRKLVGILGVTENGRPMHGWRRDGHEDVIILHDAFSACGCLEMHYSWKIGRDECEIPDKIYEDYLTPVRERTLVTLHRIFNSPMVSASRAAEAERRYQAEVANVKARKVYNFSHGRPRMHRRKRGFWQWP